MEGDTCFGIHLNWGWGELDSQALTEILSLACRPPSFGCAKYNRTNFCST